MKVVEVRRHSMTKPSAASAGGSELSQGGVDLARQVANGVEFACVVAGESPARGIETALAMGYAVDWTVDMSGGDLLAACYEEIGGFHAWRDWPDPFGGFAQYVERGGASAALGQHQIGVWTRALSEIGDAQSALVISHGGLIECALATLFTPATMRDWGGSFWNLEGARVGFENGEWSTCELIRLHRESDTD
jgi:hypothetical protein